jgi:hypothetical protein
MLEQHQAAPDQSNVNKHRNHNAIIVPNATDSLLMAANIKYGAASSLECVCCSTMWLILKPVCFQI